MSTERPDNDVIRPRRRVAGWPSPRSRQRCCWPGAAARTGPRPRRTTGAAGRAAATTRAPLLALDETPGGPDSPTTPPEGIAVGEPDPGGGGVVYRAAGKLPDGPDTAAVHRAKGTVTAAEVARLAKALGVAGTPQAEGTAWKVGSDEDGSGPLLRVNKQAPGTWTFARYGSGGTDNCQSTTVCSSKDMAPGGAGSPVSEKAAKKAAAPVLKAVGQDDAKLDASQLMGAGTGGERGPGGRRAAHVRLDDRYPGRPRR